MAKKLKTEKTPKEKLAETMIGKLQIGFVKEFFRKYGIYTILILALIVSLMPIIAWWGGLVGLIYVIITFYLLSRSKKITFKNLWPALVKIRHTTPGRLSFYAILFGILIHGACRIHSEILIQKLHGEAIHEKNIIVKTEEP